MKKNLLILLFGLFLVSNSQAQLCGYTWTNAGATNVFSFAAASFFPSPPYQYNWDMGDGNTVSGQVITYAYNTPGTYLVCLNLLDSLNQLMCTYCDSITAGGSSSCSFSAQPASPAGMDWIFSTSAAPGTIQQWSFGDGTSGTGNPVTHTYTMNGTFLACLNVLDSASGNTLCTYCDSVQVGTPVSTCNFSFIPDSMNSNTINFVATAAAGATVTWDFGDNTSGTGTTTSHTFAAPGVYIVCMTATPFLGTTCSFCAPVTVGNSSGPCNISFTTDPLNPNLFTFDSPAISAVVQWSWDFGDGSPLASGQTVAHQYAAPGVYTVCVTQSEVGTGNILCTSCISVTVGPILPPCHADYLSTSLGLTGFFIDLSTPATPYTNYDWDFGDGATSTLRFPQHTYASPGTYNACLTVSAQASPGGMIYCTDQYCAPIVVDTGIVAPLFCQAYFVILQLAPYQVAVVNLSSGVNPSFLWDFGDGTSSTLPYPSHYYNSTGNFLLCLTISDTTGCTSTYCDTMTVDSLGNVYRMANGFTVNVISPSQLTGIEDVPGRLDFAVYPNPVDDKLTVIMADKAENSQYRLVSLEGKTVFEGRIDSETTQIQTNQLAPGIYFLHVWNRDGSQGYQKIIKQ